MESWFAVWTRSRHEQVVREQLETKRIDAFLPTITRWSRWKDRKKKIDWPLFPGYCFARFDPQNALSILKCTGVVSIVSFEGKPAPIPEYELESIRLLVGSDLQFDPNRRCLGFHLRQKSGVSRTRTDISSRRPISIAKLHTQV